MISRDCQKFFLDLIYEYTIAEGRLNSFRDTLYKRVYDRDQYIDIFVLLLSNGKGVKQKLSKKYPYLPVLTPEHLRVLLEDFQIPFQREELKPLCSLISQDRNSNEITFEDFIDWALPDLEQGDNLKKNLFQKWADHGKYLDSVDGNAKEITSRVGKNYSSTQIKDKFQKFFESSMTRYGRKRNAEPEMAIYEFNQKTFELKVRPEKSRSNRNTSRNSRRSHSKKSQSRSPYKSPKQYLGKPGVVSGRVQANFLPKIESGVCILDEFAKEVPPHNRKLNKLKIYIYQPLKTMILTELKNFRWLKIASRLISGEISFKRSRLFKMMDFESQGTISINNIKQFCLRHDKPLTFPKLKQLFRRMKVGLQQRIGIKEFSYIFFDVYNKDSKKDRHLYNLYYNRPDEAGKGTLVGEGRRLVVRTHRRKFKSTRKDRSSNNFRMTEEGVRKFRGFRSGNRSVEITRKDTGLFKMLNMLDNTRIFERGGGRREKQPKFEPLSARKYSESPKKLTWRNRNYGYNTKISYDPQSKSLLNNLRQIKQKYRDKYSNNSSQLSNSVNLNPKSKQVSELRNTKNHLVKSLIQENSSKIARKQARTAKNFRANYRGNKSKKPLKELNEASIKLNVSVNKYKLEELLPSVEDVMNMHHSASLSGSINYSKLSDPYNPEIFKMAGENSSMDEIYEPQNLKTKTLKSKNIVIPKEENSKQQQEQKAIPEQKNPEKTSFVSHISLESQSDAYSVPSLSSIHYDSKTELQAQAYTQIMFKSKQTYYDDRYNVKKMHEYFRGTHGQNLRKGTKNMVKQDPQQLQKSFGMTQMHNKLGVISNNIKYIQQLKKDVSKIGAFFKYVSLAEWEIHQKRNETISIIKSIVTPFKNMSVNSSLQSNPCPVLEESECAIIYKMMFNTMGKISIHEFMKSLENILSIDIEMESAKLLLSRINYKVSLEIEDSF